MNGPQPSHPPRVDQRSEPSAVAERRRVRRWLTSRWPGNASSVRLSSLVSWLTLAIAAGHAAAQIVLTPPWEHYDEPRHMAYVVDPDWDGQSAESSARVLAIASSLEDTGFYRRSGLGFPSLGPGPGAATLYHELAARFIALWPVESVESQLLLARAFSGLLYLLTVLLALDIGRRLTTGVERFVPALALALWPTYAHHMTAVNNDAGLTAAFSLCLWASVRILSGGPALLPLLALIGGTIAAVSMKDLGIVTPGLAGLTLLLAIRRHPVGRLVALASVAAVYGLLLRLLPLDWPAYWPSSFINAWRSTEEARHGRAALAIRSFRRDQWVDVGQPLPPRLTPSPGSLVSLGGWVWSDRPAVARLVLFTDAGSVGVEKPTQPVPTFIAATVTVPPAATQAVFGVGARLAQDGQPTTVFFDGVVLTAGRYDPGQPALFDDDHGERGHWGDASFRNLLRNGSFEDVWPNLLKIPVKFSDKLVLFLDPEVYFWAYLPTLQILTRSLWADLRWSSLIILDSHGQTWLWLTGLSLVGNLLDIGLRLRRKERRPVPVAVVVLTVVSITVWSLTFLRTDVTFWGQKLPYVSRARYAFPVIIPTLWFLVRGLAFWLPGPLQRFRVPILAVALGIFSLVGLWTSSVALLTTAE